MGSSAKRGRGPGRVVGTTLALLAVAGGWAVQRGSRPAAEHAGGLPGATASESHGEAPAAPRTVSLGTVIEESTSAPVEVTGTVQATLRSDVSAKIMGRVAQVMVNEGDRVSAGQVLLRIESADLQAAVAQAEAGVRAAQEAVKQARTGARIQTVTSSTRVEQARAALEGARQQLSLVTEGPRKQQKQQADAGVEEAEAGLAQAKANLSLVREGARRQQKLQAQQSVLQAESQYRTAKATHDRFKSLYDQEVIPRQRYDEVKAQYDTAAAQYEIAKQQASLIEEGARTQEVQAAEEGVRQSEARVRAAKQQADLSHEGGRAQEIASARAQVQQAEQALRMAEAATAENTIKHDNISLLLAQEQQARAGLQAARVQAGYAVVSAPFTGVVTARRVDPGAMAAPGVPLMKIEDAGAYRLEATVPESRMAVVQPGMALPVAVESLKWKGTGRVVEFAANAEPGSRTFVVKVSIPPVPRLASGVFGKAWLPGDQRVRLVAPASAVVRRGQLESVLAVDPQGVARMRMVRTGETANGQVEILSGVQAGERVVTESPADIPDGTHVRVH